MTARLDDNLGKFFDKAFQKIEKQIEFAALLTANAITEDVKTGVERQLKSNIDRPTPFTKKAFRVKRANKKTLAATVEIKPVQAKYLKYQIEGGTRRNEPVVIPRKRAANRYGNLPRGKLNRLRQQGKSFIADGLVLQKMKRKNRPLAFLADEAKYKKRFKFFERARGTANKVAQKRYSESIKYALSTAR